MALDVYFKEDVKNILRATLVASEGSTALIGDMLQDRDLDQEAAVRLVHMYKQGFASALGAIALAFGLDMPAPTQQWQIKRPASDRVGGGAQLPSRTKSEPEAEPPLEDFDLVGFLWAKSEYERQRG